ncbi:MAG TPA: 1-deoxy-D-xylulose-5-phosphate synthase [Candidatus Baltobacteraceae bacterium]|jgi:1-deoxy-D-xylulose-5-phosphate synthase|nr:1-deoxy-D-xylulose-5-phosphate synthase [Candidatus Baltobacteraceae bacterium]
MVIERVNSPADVKALTREELDVLAREIRDLLVATCARNGGHLAPNLGVVELTLALHRVLDLPSDKLVWDVSHQAYVHKILTGRRDRFGTLRQGGGISGFSMRSESEYDAFGAGHASTSVSSALGMAIARDLAGRNETVVAVLGDGALTGGLAYEALNNAGQLDSNFIVVLNDNEMSIAPNVGSIASYLSVLRSKPLANFVREKAKDVFEHVPLGGTARKAFASAEMAAIRFVSPTQKTAVIFEELGFRYMGPFDGHNVDVLIDALHTAKAIDGPVLLHVRTKKGKGYEPAENDSRTFHGVSTTFDVENGKLEIKPDARPTYSDAFASALCAVAEKNARVIGITAAMPDGTKLSKFAKKYPERFFDVGIAEAHAVCFAAGAAATGLKPVCAIYSTFLQRAYDQVVHDVCVQNLPVVFCMDRAGLVGDDGPTHMGLYDIAYMRTLPNMTLMAPRDEDELLPMLEHALSLDGPVGIRYPRGSTSGRHRDPVAPLVQGKAEVLRRGRGVAILALGNTVDVALDAYELLASGEFGPSDRLPTVVNARFAKPVDAELIEALTTDHSLILTLEEHALAGGFGSAVVEIASDRRLPVAIERVGIADVLVQHDSQAGQRALFGLSSQKVAERVARAQNIETGELAR